MSNVNYSFTNQTSDGSLVFRSAVNSFGLDHITDKEISSFYTNFSSLSYLDTGLLPVDGSGLLSVRSAGPHTQIAYQHKPGMYYINWGSHEGDRNALKYYVAQPYRIVIADLLNGNILGARTFYSPVPITYPEAPLYHVNLPNINCKGYRGNGVGWICLYHNEDISNYPFNEKVAKILDRCSGTEAYNDANMNETDGPRFYSSNNKPIYTWHPNNWQSYSEDNGYEWTLDPDLWIPILVQDRDHQDKHYQNGHPLTFVDAIIGNYQAYYTDSLIPKPVNAIVRNDISISSNTIFNWFKQAYNSSSSSLQHIDPYANSSKVRVQTSIAPPVFSQEEDNEDYWNCETCGESYLDSFSPISTYNSDFICESCINEYYSWCSSMETFISNDEALYLNKSEQSVHISHSLPFVDYKYCESCSNGWHSSHPDFEKVIFVEILPEHELQHLVYVDHLCSSCFNQIMQDKSQPLSNENESPF